ncbi:espin-like protein [Labrus bergylta]|uniref:espin-like protein n=1 Tax=Labrus bergylta TaxID=56723 RepID=UPI0033135F61
MTEDDLNRIEKQIENLQVMHKVSEVEKELEELERELHQLLPVSAALNQGHFSVNPKQVHGQAEDLPAWCSKISTLLKSMAILLATLGGKEIDILDLIHPGYSQEKAKNVSTDQSEPAGSVGTGFIGRSQSFSTREDVEKEMKQFGVSVKNLKANYEIQGQAQSTDDKANRVYKRKRSLPVVSESCYHPETICEDDVNCFSAEDPHSHTNGDMSLVEDSVLPLVQEPVIVQSHAPQLYTPSEAMAPTNIEQFNQILSADPILNNDQLTRSLEVQTDLSYVQECVEIRKERIVFLFLEHWRKYTISECYQTKYTGPRGNYLNVGWEDFNQSSAQIGGEMQSEDNKLLLFMKSKQVVGNLIGHWRTIMSQVPTRQINRLSRAQMIYWPEHFLPHINGSPISYESLTLDLFMLGYFQLLEMSMTRCERKFRHLLCYEMFDRLGSHKWEVIRQFHKEVMEEMERGKRDWADGFEDIKIKYFGDSDGGGGVMTASLHSMSPDMSVMPLQESLPPAPSHPPPPPPPTHPAPPPPNAQSTKKELSPQLSLPPSQSAVSPSSSLAASHDNVYVNGQSVDQSTLKESVKDNAQGSVDACLQLSSVEEVVSNGKSSEQANAQSFTYNVEYKDESAKSEILQESVESSGQDPVKVAPAVTDKVLDEHNSEKGPHRDEHNEESIKTIYELKEFSNEEIIRYIDRSFAFWKEKEAELFDL